MLPRKWAATFLLKLEILLLIVRMSSGSRFSDSFAPRKAKERLPVDNMHLGRFNCYIFLVLRPASLNLSRNKLQGKGGA